jgi:hypothetical protein
MALITCPECGKEVSDKCEQCIHCGYPLINTKCVICGEAFDFKDELSLILSKKQECYIHAIGNIRKKTSLRLSLTDGKALADIMKETKSIPTDFVPKWPFKSKVKSDYDVECPYCHSTDTKKISDTSKAMHTAMFGIFSVSRNNKQWHCNKCGSDF